MSKFLYYSLFVIILTFITEPLLSQFVIKCSSIDRVTHNVLKATYVKVTGIDKEFYPNENGNFIIDLPLPECTYELTFFCDGYHSNVATVYKKLNFIINMDKKPEATILASSKPSTVQNTPTPKKIIDSLVPKPERPRPTDSINSDDLPPSNLIFLVDVSGSMNSENKIGILQQAALNFFKNVRWVDKISLIVYSGESRVVLDGLTGDKSSELTAAILSLQAKGQTNYDVGIEDAYKLAEKHYINFGNNRIIVITDGDFDLASSNACKVPEMIEYYIAKDIRLSCIGVGLTTSNGERPSDKFVKYAKKGKGYSSWAETSIDFESILMKEFMGILYHKFVLRNQNAT